MKPFPALPRFWSGYEAVNTESPIRPFFPTSPPQPGRMGSGWNDSPNQPPPCVFGRSGAEVEALNTGK
eukprot:12885681-Prorocentrum_lima.AAC.1